MEINEDWELVNDNGFVYKRQKRQNLDSAVAAVPPPDPAAEAKARRERKKKTLLKLKTKYEQEIHHWELLSNTLQALQDRTQNQSLLTLLSVPDHTVNVLQQDSSDSTYRERTDTLLAQVEAQEATISEISRLCDVAEALCNVEEQRLKQPFLDLPIWDPSPQEEGGFPSQSSKLATASIMKFYHSSPSTSFVQLYALAAVRGTMLYQIEHLAYIAPSVWVVAKHSIPTLEQPCIYACV